MNIGCISSDGKVDHNPNKMAKHIDEIAIDRSSSYARKRIWFYIKFACWRVFPCLHERAIRKAIQEHEKANHLGR